MGYLKFRIRRINNLIYCALLAFLGFQTSCEKIVNSKTEYGSPNADFKINGKIEATASGEVIEGIKITMKRKFVINDSVDHIAGIDSVLSDAEGKYEVVHLSGFPDDATYYLRIEDIDGALNGSYYDLDTVVQFIDPQFTGGDGNWDQGVASKELNVKLKLKK